MLPSLRRFLYLAPLLMVTMACPREPDFSIIPEITPKAVIVDHQTETGGTKLAIVNVTIGFTDGDGDLGRIDTTDKSFNYFITMQKKKGEVFKVFTPTGLSLNGHFDNLNPQFNKKMKLRGELSYKVNSTFTLNSSFPSGKIDGVPEFLRAGDVVRFEVQIKDRAGNMSNKLTTDPAAL